MGRAMMVLYRGEDCWMVLTDDPHVRRLFGTNRLPTAYTLDLPAVRVLQQIQELNPDCEVAVEEGSSC